MMKARHVAESKSDDESESSEAEADSSAGGRSNRVHADDWDFEAVSASEAKKFTDAEQGGQTGHLVEQVALGLGESYDKIRGGEAAQSTNEMNVGDRQSQQHVEFAVSSH